ncbi:MAG: hypothetical protein WAW52_13170 [Methanothrix sp.]
MKMCNSMVKLGAGDRSNPLSIWYDKTLLTFTKELMDQMSEIARQSREFQQEYGRLSSMASCFCDNPRALLWISYSRSMIEQFFAYAENLPPASHRTADSLPCDPQRFSDLLSTIMYVADEIQKIDMPCTVKYARLLHNYEILRASCIAGKTEENKRAMDEMYLKITSFHPPGPMYKTMNTLRRTLDVVQYKIEAHLLNLLTLADSAGEAIAMTDYALAIELYERCLSGAVGPHQAFYLGLYQIVSLLPALSHGPGLLACGYTDPRSAHQLRESPPLRWHFPAPVGSFRPNTSVGSHHNRLH